MLKEGKAKCLGKGTLSISRSGGRHSHDSWKVCAEDFLRRDGAYIAAKRACRLPGIGGQLLRLGGSTSTSMIHCLETAEAKGPSTMALQVTAFLRLVDRSNARSPQPCTLIIEHIPRPRRTTSISQAETRRHMESWLQQIRRERKRRAQTLFAT